MATKTKLGASLRNSISAEKKSVENKKFEIKNDAPTNKKDAISDKENPKLVEAKKDALPIKENAKSAITKKNADLAKANSKPAATKTSAKSAKDGNKSAKNQKAVKLARLTTTKNSMRKSSVTKSSLTAAKKPDAVIPAKAKANKAKTDSIFGNYSVTPLMDLSKFSPAISSNFNGVRQAIEKLADVNHNITNLCIENLAYINDSFNKYVRDLIEVNSPISFYNANLAFITKCRVYQQELFSKNIQALNLLHT